MKDLLIVAVILVVLAFGMIKCVDYANAANTVRNPDWSGFETFYDERTSVFCATRTKAVSCVYVPRDTVR